ncbi:carbon-phosphorus lyase complex subunit PhnI [Heliorestis acidaminivorans]|uniref:Carbon-phosphorus lyase complex subunit PhnI n=1 Tax=Heliorestis acidaminivorans TaxID=553427 RepID=A0A6I0ETP2_9FIRM|nr:carbon-phosphorus lyase complex subunit PhnI [Heliorestis acidaminivorans]KAB2953459.1 carbon-phosphorus lyase complex subunit PhnI [Heliorestis acidaminivorans]
MGYVAVKGGSSAIEESIKRLQYQRIKAKKKIDVEVIQGTLRGLIDKIMSESSLYARELAALAIKQAEGNPEEATFILRAYRSTLPRKYYSQVVDTEDMRIERRISAALKDIPGGQILGASYDYRHRLLDFELYEEKIEDLEKLLQEFEAEGWSNSEEEASGAKQKTSEHSYTKVPKVISFLRAEGLLPPVKIDDSEPDDITRKSIEFPTRRSARLQTLTRGEAGAVTALGYAAIRGYGMVHPTVGELRVGYLPIHIDYPLQEGNEEDAVYIGEIEVTEVESLIPQVIEKEKGRKEIEFTVGYGLCYGQNETKAIAMSILDSCLAKKDLLSPTAVHDEEFVLLHIDAVEASGFISHLKLPHYVTFQSELDSLRKTKKKEENHESI